ncbi:MAG: hypothetical protein JO246_02220 [Frankiaceae bacterium]|nr:hypothetical protein [Frankiaceae bacterium]MBV9872877.1 hypothetical protein [Frankiaceae bacterium]
MGRRAIGHSDRLAMARRRGAVAGPLLMILGAWGALIPFFGHAFSYGYTPNNTWHWTQARGWLEVLPGAVAFVGGLLLTMAGNRLTAMIGGWMAALAGGWFVVGTVIAPWWSPGDIGSPMGSADRVVWEQLGMFYGLGAVIVFLAALGIGRASVVGIRDIEAVESRRETIDLTDDGRTETTTATAPVSTRRTVVNSER